MYLADNITSYFDNPERSSTESIEGDKELLSKHKIITKILDGFPNAAMLLNKNRQIVAYNKNAVSLVTGDGFKSVYGQRVGEAIGCVHAFDMPAGCGTSKFCEECGAGQCNKYTRESLLDAKQECRVIVNKDNVQSSIDLRISTSIIELDDNTYTLFAIEDIQDEKRRKVLEKIFFHDVLNTANSVYNISEIINSASSLDEVNEFKQMMFTSTEQLVKEIQSQRDLINAEQGTLSVNIEVRSVNDILRKAYSLYKDHKLSIGIDYSSDLLSNDFEIKTDGVLLIRCVGNLIKNALEATDAGGKVRVFSQKDATYNYISIFNDKVMPEEIQLQIFQRSFSTKANSGRGIGTYSVKLLVEQYLKGKVNFVSNNETKTVFTISIPVI
ncbi:MAG: HAMP domain-containing sensor histidine kinase [Ignavibacteriaceae bacterium]